jgi:Multicopper oxidase
MASRNLSYPIFLVVLICLVALPAGAQSFRVQCPTSTITHPAADNNSEPAYNGPTTFALNAQGYVTPALKTVNGAIKCQQISGGDGYATMADGTQTFLFAFGPLSGLADIAAGHAGTQYPKDFNTPFPGSCTACNPSLVRGDPATTDGATTGASSGLVYTSTGAYNPAFTWNGAVGLAPDIAQVVNVTDIQEGAISAPATAPGCPPTANTVTAWTDAPLGIPVGQMVQIQSATPTGGTPTPPGYLGTFPVTCVATGAVITPGGFTQFAFQYMAPTINLPADTGNDLAAVASAPQALDGHVDPRRIMDIGVMNGNIPAPLIAFDEDDEFFLTLTNVGMIMRPDLFEQHTVHFHGYPNASSFYDGVPDASIAINIGASFTYYYLAPDAGTYFWHCHITPPEHLQMGMVGQLYVRPRQDRVPAGNSLFTGLQQQNSPVDLRTACNPAADILCSAVTPPADPGVARAAAGSLCSNPGATGSGLTPDYVYNDGDGSTCYDVTYPIQMHGFDPNFHFVGMTFNPELFVDMRDKFFLLNGRSYPDTVGPNPTNSALPFEAPGPQATVTTDGQMHYSQPLPAVINIPFGGKASLRLVNLSVAEYFTLQTLGIPMHVVGWNAKLLRDQAGNNTEYWSNSITLGGGESNDVILDASDAGCGTPGCAAMLYPAGSIFYLYEPDLDRLSNDAENFGGMMTEVHICNSVTGGNTFGNSCN